MSTDAPANLPPEIQRSLQQEWPKIAIYNDKSSGESDSTVEKWASALAKQVTLHFGPLWNNYGELHFVPSTKKPPADMWVIALLGTSDQAGALGYHDLTPNGQPLGKVFAASDREYNSSVSVTLSHELLEMLGDPYIDLSVQGSDGKFYAYESCDAVEDDSLAYTIDGVLVSDFVTPSWFDSNGTNVDFLGHITKPFELAKGGYIGVFDPSSGQGWTQVTAQSIPVITKFGASLADSIPPHALPRIGSRRERRFRGKGNWNFSEYEAE